MAHLKKERGVFCPITTKSELKKLYAEYKESFGSIRRCIAFFSALEIEEQKALFNSVDKDGTPTESIKKLAEYLYQLRSKFVHEAEFVLEIGASPIYSFTDKGVFHSTLKVTDIFDAFENGVLAHFNHGLPIEKTGNRDYKSGISSDTGGTSRWVM